MGWNTTYLLPNARGLCHPVTSEITDGLAFGHVYLDVEAYELNAKCRAWRPSSVNSEREHSAYAFEQAADLLFTLFTEFEQLFLN